jgi:phage repressor protein C with HTH and peptisase S24 domain
MPRSFGIVGCLRDDFENGSLNARAFVSSQEIGHRLFGESERALKSCDRAVSLPDFCLNIFAMHVREGHVSSPKFRPDFSVNPKTRRDQGASTENSVGERILLSLGDRSRSWLARQTELPESTIGDAIKRGPAKTDVALRLSEALEVDLSWLLTGAIGPSGSVTGAVDHLANSEAVGGAIRSQASLGPNADDLDLVEVQEIDLAYGLGGQFSDGPVEVRTHHFPRDWVRSITATPASMLTIARGRGDSMQPTIQDGDMVIIDRSQRTIREQDAMWALTIGDFAMIKRVRSRGERIQILSDNTLVPMDEAHHEEINVVGRVIFVGRRV